MGEKERQAKGGSVQTAIHCVTANRQVQTRSRLETVGKEQANGQRYQGSDHEPGNGFEANAAHRTVSRHARHAGNQRGQHQGAMTILIRRKNTSVTRFRYPATSLAAAVSS